VSTLKQAIERAIDNGWDMWGCAHHEDFRWSVEPGVNVLYMYRKGDNSPYAIFRRKIPFSGVIFDHDFAKALFSQRVCHDSGIPQTRYYIDRCGYRGALCEPVHKLKMKEEDYCGQYYSPWQYHLQQLAIAPDRLKYLEEYMEGLDE